MSWGRRPCSWTSPSRTTDPYLPPGEYGLGYYRVDPRQLYNGIFYLDISPKMTPLAWPSCQ